MELGDASNKDAPPPCTTKRETTMPKEERDVEIFAVANDFDAPKHAMQ